MASIQELGPGRWLSRVRRYGVRTSSVWPTQEEAICWGEKTEQMAHALRGDRLMDAASMRRMQLDGLDPHALQRFQLEGFCGVYFLFKAGELVYIGQALNVPQRIEQHVYKIGYDEWAWMPVPRASLDSTEQFLIRKFKPRNNQTHNPDRRKRNGTSLLQTAREPAPTLAIESSPSSGQC